MAKKISKKSNQAKNAAAVKRTKKTPKSNSSKNDLNPFGKAGETLRMLTRKIISESTLTSKSATHSSYEFRDSEAILYPELVSHSAYSDEAMMYEDTN